MHPLSLFLLASSLATTPPEDTVFILPRQPEPEPEPVDLAVAVVGPRLDPAAYAAPWTPPELAERADRPRLLDARAQAKVDAAELKRERRAAGRRIRLRPVAAR